MRRAESLTEPGRAFPVRDLPTASSTSALLHVGRRAASSVETLEATYDIARATIERRVSGDFVECGVFLGSNAAMLAVALMEAGEHRTRKLHLFDSFEGIPLAGPEDVEFLASGQPAGLSSCSLQSLRSNFAEWGIPEDFIIYHPGWFQEIIPEYASKHPTIALLRLDADLYRSTKVCMQYLYPLVSTGGWVIVDDYHLTGCRLAVHETVVPGPVYWVKQPHP